MDDLPELPFEKVLSYLSLEDRLKARAVSWRWYHKINCFRVKSLCYSRHPIGRILGKSRWVIGSFAQNFISSSRFASFFDTFGQTILSSLKHLRLCDLDLNKEDPTAFARTLNSFSHLEELDIIRAKFDSYQKFNLNLPMLTRFQLEGVHGTPLLELTLEAPRLREIKILDCFSYLSHLRVGIVHGESVERLLLDRFEYTDVKKLKNLKALYIRNIFSTSLSSLQQLKEIHTHDPNDVSELFEQKQRSGRADLKIYFRGLLLNRPDDPAIDVRRDSFRNWLVCLAENRSRLADEIPFYSYFSYSHIERVASGLEVDLLKRFTNLNHVTIDRPLQDTQRFLDFLKNCENISELWFECDQLHDLFDRLPEHCAVQKLILHRAPSDLAFLFRLKHLIELKLHWSINSETIRRALEELPVLSSFEFAYDHKMVSIRIRHPKQFHVRINYRYGHMAATKYNLNAAIEFITGKTATRSNVH